MINEQILVSDLEPSIAGSDLIYQLNRKLEKSGCDNQNTELLISILRKCDNASIGERFHFYKELNNLLSQICSIRKENLLHIDCLTTIERGSIGNSIQKAVLRGIDVLSKLITLKENETLTTFKSKFYNRYEEQQIPLAIALDPQIGIGFGRWNEMKGDVTPLIDKLPLPLSKERDLSLHIDSLTRLLLQKYEESLKNDSYCIYIDETDLKAFEIIGENALPDHLHVMLSVISVYEANESTVIFMNSVVGGSAAKLLSRFTYLDSSIDRFVNEITKFESEYYPDKILAEILHLPEDRVGNIQMHFKTREYSIPYLSHPDYSNSEVEMIPIDDIMVSVPGGTTSKRCKISQNPEIQ